MRYCHHPGCSTLVTRGRCAQHQVREAARPHADVRRLYRTVRWARLRAALQQADPLCAQCRAEGHVEPWTELHHKQPHRGDLARFWDAANLEGLCATHHGRATQRETLERRV